MYIVYDYMIIFFYCDVPKNVQRECIIKLQTSFVRNCIQKKVKKIDSCDCESGKTIKLHKYMQTKCKSVNL